MTSEPGSSTKKLKSKLGWSAFALGTFIFLCIQAYPDNSSRPTSSTADSKPPGAPANSNPSRMTSDDYKAIPDWTPPRQPPARAQEEQSAWSYSDRVDKITGKQIHFAIVDAPETLDFEFPYSGGSTASLQVRKHPRYGTDVILSVDKGQFVCDVVEDCSVMVRFDEGRPTRYSASVPSDYSSTYLFIKPAGKFISSTKKAKRVVIEARFFQEGNRAIVFPIHRLVW